MTVVADDVAPGPSVATEVVEAEKQHGGRVIEYSPDGTTTISNKTTGRKPEPKKEKQEVQSVKIITGGDPSEGNAKVGRLPILD